jgi:hypothetical protein
MSNVNSLLTERLKKGDHSSKMATLAKQSASGQLTSFSGIFGVSELTNNEKSSLERILTEYALEDDDVSNDLASLVSITSEVKAINNQAVLLHGERIKKAHGILTKYRDGAFTAWLIAAYGNRQTPYNFLQYYEFYETLPKALKPKVDTMPRQAVYTLASRQGAFEKKQAIITNYKGETKTELLQHIRKAFPLDVEDKRREDVGESAIKTLTRLYSSLKGKRTELSKQQKRSLGQLLENLQQIL